MFLCKQNGQIHILARISTWQKGFRTARHGALQVTGSYWRRGVPSCFSFKGVYRAPIGTTRRLASMREDGKVFHDSRTPSRSSISDHCSFSASWSILLLIAVGKAVVVSCSCRVLSAHATARAIVGGREWYRSVEWAWGRIIIKVRRGRICIYLTSLPWTAHATISKRSSSKVQELGPAAPPVRCWPMRWEPSKLDFTLAAGLVSFLIYIITCQPQFLLFTTAGLLLMQ